MECRNNWKLCKPAKVRPCVLFESSCMPALWRSASSAGVPAAYSVPVRPSVRLPAASEAQWRPSGFARQKQSRFIDPDLKRTHNPGDNAGPHICHAMSDRDSLSFRFRGSLPGSLVLRPREALKGATTLFSAYAPAVLLAEVYVILHLSVFQPPRSPEPESPLIQPTPTVGSLTSRDLRPLCAAESLFQCRLHHMIPS